jgi:hypothetical protein
MSYRTYSDAERKEVHRQLFNERGMPIPAGQILIVGCDAQAQREGRTAYEVFTEMEKSRRARESDPGAWVLPENLCVHGEMVHTEAFLETIPQEHRESSKKLLCILSRGEGTIRVTDNYDLYFGPVAELKADERRERLSFLNSRDERQKVLLKYGINPDLPLIEIQVALAKRLGRFVPELEE